MHSVGFTDFGIEINIPSIAEYLDKDRSLAHIEIICAVSTMGTDYDIGIVEQFNLFFESVLFGNDDAETVFKEFINYEKIRLSHIYR